MLKLEGRFTTGTEIKGICTAVSVEKTQIDKLEYTAFSTGGIGRTICRADVIMGN